MNKERCKSCFWGDKCCSVEDCKHYFPMEDDTAMELYIECRRQEFYDEWRRYTAEW